jgi:hypothetical protein
LRLADVAVSAQTAAIGKLLVGSMLELWADDVLIVALPVSAGTQEGGELTFGPMGPVSARAAGEPTVFRMVRSGGSLILEGNAKTEMQVEPTSSIEKGAAVTIAGIIYRQPAGGLEEE